MGAVKGKCVHVLLTSRAERTGNAVLSNACTGRVMPMPREWTCTVMGRARRLPAGPRQANLRAGPAGVGSARPADSFLEDAPSLCLTARFITRCTVIKSIAS